MRNPFRYFNSSPEVIRLVVMMYIRRRGSVKLMRTRQRSARSGFASGCQLTPLGQRGGAVLLEDVASAEVAIVVKVIVDRGVDGGEFLKGLDVPEFRHCPFPSSERLV